jgi:hypothetical protein
MNPRFTLDGSDALELQLGRTCARLSGGVQSIIPEGRLEGIVLGGGYGRGEGGVLRSDTGDLPYNDLEFYVFVRGPRLLNERRYRARLDRLAEELSPPGLHAEFKIDSLEKLRQSRVSMFSYDLVAGHKIFLGDDSLFTGCWHHLDSGGIPLVEATRLLFNRCGGLLLAKGLFRTRHLSESEADFVGRNLAKAQLALGDAVLTAFGQYHWSCPGRHKRLLGLALPEPPNWLDTVRAHHGRGVAFKLHPRRISRGVDEFREQHEELAQLASQLWLWLESRRLSCPFASPREYAFSRVEKCPETSAWKNYLLNLKTFGFKAGLDPCCCRYPRERLFNALALLLWNGEFSKEPAVKRHVQRQLHSDASDWPGLVAAFRQVWPSYG